MGWSFRKSISILPGIRISLSRSGPRLSVGIPGARASVDMRGKVRVYGGRGPIRFQKSMDLNARSINQGSGVALLSHLFGRRK